MKTARLHIAVDNPNRPFNFVEPEVQYETPAELKEKFEELYAAMNPQSDDDAMFFDWIISVLDSDMTKWGLTSYYETITDPRKKAVMQSMKRFYKRFKDAFDDEEPPK